MTRLALAIVVAAAGVATLLTDRTPETPTVTSSATAPSDLPLRVSRARERQPLPGRQTSHGHRRQGATPTQHRRAPVRHSGPSRPAPGSALLDITAYCATGNSTASGKQPAVGMAAGNRWPFGTRLHIDGYGDVTIEDRIGWGSDVDLYFGDDPGCEQRASNFGRKHLRVSVIPR